MARARSLKPGFFTNDELAQVDPLGRLLFAGLWTLADREGRLEDRVKRIKATLLPYDEIDVDALLDDLAARGFIHRYQVDDESYIQVVEFAKHQNPHVKEPPSLIPAPCDHCAGPVSAPEIPEPARPVPHSPFPLPDSIAGLRGEVWTAWLKHRGKKLTAYAVKLQVAKLLDLQRAGHDPNDVIEQSIERGWTGLFEVRANGPPARAGEEQRPVRAADRRAANMAELTGQVRHERTVEGVTEGVGRAALPAIPGHLRE